MGLLLITPAVFLAPHHPAVAAVQSQVAAAQSRVAAFAALSAGNGDTAVHFPQVKGTNLEGRKFALPAEFEGELNVVLVAFRREQQADVDGWMPFLKQLTGGRPAMRVYELPTLTRSYRWMRSFIDGGMARGIPERATREATITLYIDKTPFKRSLAIDAEDRIVTLLVDRAGRVLWRADGVYSAEAGAALERAAVSAAGTGS